VANASTGPGWDIAQLLYLRHDAAGTEVFVLSFLRAMAATHRPRGPSMTTPAEVFAHVVYDAWNRMVQVRSGGTQLQAYTYDALGRRVTLNAGTLTSLYYSSAWQVLEEQAGGVTQTDFVWSPVYLDALVEPDRGSERFYVQQDANWNVTALVDTTGTVQERYTYLPFGQPTVLTPTWAVRASSSYAWVYFFQGGRYEPASTIHDFRDRHTPPSWAAGSRLTRWVWLQTAVTYIPLYRTVLLVKLTPSVSRKSST
jgi:YD repeat-containing protein